MKRDLDLIRQMMLALEENAALNGRSHRHLSASEVAPIPGFTDDVLAYNLMMIVDEGWLDADYGMNSGKFRVTRLTADGHDFIDSTRSLDVWDEAKSIATTAGAETLKFVWEAAKGLVRAEISRRLGAPVP